MLPLHVTVTASLSTVYRREDPLTFVLVLCIDEHVCHSCASDTDWTVFRSAGECLVRSMASGAAAPRSLIHMQQDRLPHEAELDIVIKYVSNAGYALGQLKTQRFYFH